MTALPRRLRVHAGAGAPGNAAVPHWPVRAVGESITKVTVSGSPLGATAYEPFRPAAVKRTRDGVVGLVFTAALMMPWMPPSSGAVYVLRRAKAD